MSKATGTDEKLHMARREVQWCYAGLLDGWRAPARLDAGALRRRSSERLAGVGPLAAFDTFKLDARVNGRESCIPVHCGSPSSDFELQCAGDLIRAAGGFIASVHTRRMAAARMWMAACPDPARARRRIGAEAVDLLQLGLEAMPQHFVPLGCIPAIDVREYRSGDVEAMLYVEDASARSQRALRAAARALARPLAALAGCRNVAAIQLGAVQAARVHVRCTLDGAALRELEPRFASPGRSDELEATIRARFGADHHAPELAARYNAQVLEAVLRAAAALGLEPRRFEAAARGHAARWGSCEPLACWRSRHGRLHGELELPVDLSAIERGLAERGFTSDVLRRREVAADLAYHVASVGLTASLVLVRSALAATPRRERAARTPPRVRATPRPPLRPTARAPALPPARPAPRLAPPPPPAPRASARAELERTHVRRRAL